MAVQVDLEQRKVSASVHDLLPEAAGSGWPGEGWVRLSVGSELHRVVQSRLAQVNPHFAPEVPVNAEVSVDGWTLTVSGRCDGVFSPPREMPVVEEIKTLHFKSELYRPDADLLRHRFRWQVRLYAYFLFPQGDAKARLRLVDLGGEEEQLEEVRWSPGQVEAYLRTRLAVFVERARTREQLLARMRATAARLAFPFPEIRPVQREAMEAVEEALASGRHLLLSAPTGVGKTAAALFPALRRALLTGKRLVFCTAKTLQQKLAVETLAAMNDGSFRTIQIRAKAKMCANREVICHQEFCEYLQDLPGKLAASQLVRRLLEWRHVDPVTVFSLARSEGICPFLAQLETLPETVAVVCDYNYVFDPGIALFGRPESGVLAETVLVVDEAHNLVDRAREYFSPRLSRPNVAKALGITSNFRSKVCRELTRALEALDDALETTVAAAMTNREGVAPADPPLEALRHARLELEALMVPYFSFKRQQELWLAQDPVVETLLSVARFLELAEAGRPELVSLAERRPAAQGPEESLRLVCLDPAPFLAPVLEACHSCIAMSATLEPFEFYRDLLGFDPDRTDTLALPSPFPPENRLVAVVDSVDTSYRHRHRAFGPIAELIPELLPPGRNALVLFPSYRFLQEVATRLSVTTHEVLVQQSSDSDLMREEMLLALKANRKPVLLLGVLGGAFAEGVDYPGEMLSQVIVVSPALPQVSPERELLKAYFDERMGKGFAYAYLIPGMTRVVQAAGRLIRSAQDRGVIVLVCRRFLQEPYASLLPREWTDGDPRTLVHPNLPQAVQAFFHSPNS
ncbi:MAG: ATP-dependent DNA helicase [Thermoanaerobaculum sp.]